MKEADVQVDRLAVPSSARNEEEARRDRAYEEEARRQDLSDADDVSREKWETPRRDDTDRRHQAGGGEPLPAREGRGER